MQYKRIQEGFFVERPNRFIAHIEIDGRIEVVHVKNTGRCQELLIPGVKVYVQKAENPERKTQWDLIAVIKGDRIINMDSQITNYVVKEWLEQGNLIEDITLIKSEVTYAKSRFDLYVETATRKIFIEIKGVTLERNNVVLFPDAPSERAVKHVRELQQACKEGYEAYIIFVVQMEGVEYFTPNKNTHLAFAEALLEAKKNGVNIYAYDSIVSGDEIKLNSLVPVILGEPSLYELRMNLIQWYQENKRCLPWRNNITAYNVWISEIMLQQTRVEAVKPFYERFLKELPSIEALALAPETKLLKLWEGLGYYNRVRNMQIAAQDIMSKYNGNFPEEYDKIIQLKGIGSYTAGAISAFAFNKNHPAVDGNVLRVIARILGDDTDIMKASFKKRIERELIEVIPDGYASDFNQGLIELGATVCIPNGQPKCDICPVWKWCQARQQDRIHELPVKSKGKARKIEERTVLIFKDGEKLAINQRGNKGLLAKMYELPNYLGIYTTEEVIELCKSIGLTPIRVQECGESKHIFSHVEWHMKGYEVKVDELEETCNEDFIFLSPLEVQEKYPMPAAFLAYTKYLNIKIGQSAYNEHIKQDD